MPTFYKYELLMILVHLQLYSAVVVNGDFKECLITRAMKHLTYDNMCFRQHDTHSLDDDDDDYDYDYTAEASYNFKRTVFSKNAALFTKHNYLLEGTGYECSVKIHKYIFETTIVFTQRDPQIRESYLSLTRMECLNIIENQRCNRVPMNCKNPDECHFVEETPKDAWPIWWGTTTVDVYECKFHRRVLLAVNENSDVLPHAVGPCKPMNMHCVLESSTVVWNDEMIRKCPFELLIRMQDLAFTNFNHQPDYPLLISKQNKITLKLNLKTMNACEPETQFYETTEGLYVTFLRTELDKNNIKHFKTSMVNSLHIQSSDYRFLQLAEEDYKMYRVYRSIISLMCTTILNIIKSNMDNDDKFLVINESGSTEVIVYINNGLAYLPICKSVSSINIIEKPSYCYKDFAIQYGNDKKTGFLRTHGIITRSSSLEQCGLNDKKLVIDESSLVISRKSNIVTVSNYTESLKTNLTISLMSPLFKNIFEHNKILMNHDSLIEQLDDLLIAKENDDSFYLKKNEITFDSAAINVNRDGFWNQVIGFFKSLWSSIKEYANNVVYTVVSIIAIVLILYVVVCALSRSNVFSCCKRQTRRAETIELQEIQP